MVHGLNHWGMIHGQRFTEQNIDLDRNFWETQPHNPYYTEDIHSGIVAMKNQTPNKTSMVHLATRWATHGLFPWEVERKVMSGQYRFPDGFEYGGDRLAKEHQAVVEFLQKIIPN